MKKKQLMNLKKLTATDEIVQLAREDIPEQYQFYGRVYYRYKRGMYLMAEVEKNILKVALFLPDHLTLKGTEPAYSLFIDKSGDDFIGYNHLHRKWTSAMLDRISMLNPAHYKEVYCSDEDTQCIQGYLDTDRDAYDALYTFQLDLRHRDKLKRHKKVTDQWDQEMKKVPDLPKEWGRWIKKVGFSQNFIIYEYDRKGVTEGYCTWCEKMVPVDRPKHNQEGKCKCCRHKIRYKSAKKAQRILTEEETAYLVQNCGDGIVVREFMASMLIKMSDYRKPVFRWNERRRFLYDKNLAETEYYYGHDKTSEEYRWKKGNLTKSWGAGWRSYIYCVRGRVYNRNLSHIHRGILGRTGFPEYAKKVLYIDPCEYMQQLQREPILEQLVKAGLTALSKEIVNEHHYIETEAAKELGKALQIDRFRLNRLRENNGGTVYLDWLRYEKQKNTMIPDPVIRWMEKQGIQPEDLTVILEYMSALQAKNYLERQSSESGESAKDLVTTWQDYLIMAKRSGLDISDPIVYRTRYLVRRHNELAQIIGDKDIVLQAEEIERKYPMLPGICLELAKYEYADSQYKVVAPKRIEDILIEGQKLMHCIHRSDRYFERMNKKESYILFLRKAEEEHTPYYTLEVEPNGTVRQKRTLYNRQMDDIEMAEKFLVKWQKQLQKKLLREDMELAKRSKELRIKEIDELRKNEVRLNGNFNGRLLADVLAEDLMEVTDGEVLAA